jgi:hypothetical protein
MMSTIKQQSLCSVGTHNSRNYKNSIDLYVMYYHQGVADGCAEALKRDEHGS